MTLSRTRALASIKLVLDQCFVRWLLFALLVGLVVLDRGHWADVAQWREDQSCNLWLGYTRSAWTLPVGLISSVGTPNPNGMPLLSLLLSRLPNLWAVSLALGVLQGTLVLWVCWPLAGPGHRFLLAVAPALASVILRSTSVEFWNQWMLTDLNLWFFGLWIRYLGQPSPWRLAWMTLPMLWAPALYLGGLVNAVAYVLFAGVALWRRPPTCGWRKWAAPASAVLGWTAFCLRLTWSPFFEATQDSSLPGTDFTFDVLGTRLRHTLESAFEWPAWSVAHWHRLLGDHFLHGDDQILEGPAADWMWRSSWLLVAQALLCLVTLLVAAVAWSHERRRFATFFVDGGQSLGRRLLAGVAFVITCDVLSPLLGGAHWTRDERPDQQVHLLPFLLFAWFLLPWLINLARPLRRVVLALSGTLTLAFVLVSAHNGWQIVDTHLDYLGRRLSAADVPLRHQREAIAFIARDWKAVSGAPEVPVFYEHGMDWVNDFGKKILRWYPAPMTIGRAFDYELLRVYGLRNSQEGIQVRTRGPARYIVSYRHSAAPTESKKTMTHYYFGRVRVTVATITTREPTTPKKR